MKKFYDKETKQLIGCFGKIEEMNRDFDLEYWDTQTLQARWDAAWELAVHYHTQVLGESIDELRLDRTIGGFYRLDHE